MKTIGIMILSAGVLAVLLGLRNTVEWQAEAKSREAAGGLGVISPHFPDSLQKSTLVTYNKAV